MSMIVNKVSSFFTVDYPGVLNKAAETLRQNSAMVMNAHKTEQPLSTSDGAAASTAAPEGKASSVSPEQTNKIRNIFYAYSRMAIATAVIVIAGYEIPRQALTVICTLSGVTGLVARLFLFVIARDIFTYMISEKETCIGGYYKSARTAYEKGLSANAQELKAYCSNRLPGFAQRWISPSIPQDE